MHAQTQYLVVKLLQSANEDAPIVLQGCLPGVFPESVRYFRVFQQVKPPRGKTQGILIRMAELSVAFSPPSLKPRRALLAIHPHAKLWGFLAKESK